MPIRQGVQLRCRYCRSFIDASMVRKAQVQRDGIKAVIFRKTIPLLVCPVCDTAPQDRGVKMFAPTA